MDNEAIAAKLEAERAEIQLRKNIALMTRIREHLATQQTEENTPLALDRAISHPILGGILRANPKADVAGPTFTVASLRRAILKGDLKCVHHGRLQFVTPAQLREWITRKPDEPTGSVPKPAPTPPSLSPAAQTLCEKRDGNASVALAFAALDAIKPSPGRPLKPAKRGR